MKHVVKNLKLSIIILFIVIIAVIPLISIAGFELYNRLRAVEHTINLIEPPKWALQDVTMQLDRLTDTVNAVREELRSDIDAVSRRTDYNATIVTRANDQLGRLTRLTERMAATEIMEEINELED